MTYLTLPGLMQAVCGATTGSSFVAWCVLINKFSLVLMLVVAACTYVGFSSMKGLGVGSIVYQFC